MTIIRPVTKRLPESSFVLDESGPFPLGFVILPFGNRSDIHKPVEASSSQQNRGGARRWPPLPPQQGEKRPNQREEFLAWHLWTTPKKDSSGTYAFEQLEDDDDDDDEPPTSTGRSQKPTPLLSAALVSRCTHCGALHNPCNIDLVPSGFGVVCSLCGRIFDPMAMELQRRARAPIQSPLFGTDGEPSGGLAATLSRWVSYMLNSEEEEEEEESARAFDKKKKNGDTQKDCNMESYGKLWEQRYRHRHELASRSRYNRGPHLQVDQRRRRQHQRLSENPIIDVDNTHVSSLSPLSSSSHLPVELDECKHHVIEYALPIGASFSSSFSSSSSLSSPQAIYEVPAIECPPLVAVCIDASSPQTSCYYQAIAACLLKSLVPPMVPTTSSPSSIPPAILALFVLTPGGGISVFDLGSPVPHLKHVTVASPTNDNGGHVPLAKAMDLCSAFVPVAHKQFRSNVQAAIRALENHTVTIDQACGNSNNNNKKAGRIHLASSLDAILDFLDDAGAVHPGVSHESSPDGLPPCRFPPKDENSFGYAGGKIMCFLGGPPEELRGKAEPPKRQGRSKSKDNDPEKRAMQPLQDDAIGTGGFGGTIAPVGERFEVQGDPVESTVSEGSGFPSKEESVATMDDLESGGLAKETHDNDDGDDQEEDEDRWAHYEKEHLQHMRNNHHVNDMYKELGTRCALAALGVEVFVLLEPSQDSVDEADCNANEVARGPLDAETTRQSEDAPYIGIPTLQILTHHSGGCAPLLFRLPFDGQWRKEELKDEDIMNAPGGTVGCLIREVHARCPWARPTAFGGLLRVRMSPTIKVDTQDLFTLDWLKPAKPNRTNNPFTGPCVESPDGDNLLLLGTCDASTALSMDIEVGTTPGGPVYHGVHLDERGEMNLPPCVQTAFAYTAVVARRQPATDTISYATVRRLRVVTSNVDVAVNSESLTESLDMEVLALVLFRKICAAAYTAGLEEARCSTMDWALSALAATYRSAELYASEGKESKERLGGDNRPPQHVVTSFVPHDRLLDRGNLSSLSHAEILLARGHERLCDLPLLVFSILQSDALCPPRRGAFRPSLDARCAAASNMLHMDPSTLFRCLIPHLTLWNFQNDQTNERGTKTLEIAMDDIDPHTEALCFAIQENGPGAASPAPTPLLLLDSPRQIVLCLARPGMALSTGNVSTEEISANTQVQRLLQACRESYPEPPPVQLDLEPENRRGAMLSSRSLHLLQDALVGDSILRIRVGSVHNALSFQKWRALLADAVHEDLFRDGKNKG